MNARVSLTGLKVARFASEETLCFEATVALDGVKFARAHNDGRGGMTCVDVLTQPDTAIGQAQRKAYAEAEAYCAALPHGKLFIDGKLMDTFPMNLEHVVEDLADRECAARDYRRKCKKFVLAAYGGQLWQYRIQGAAGITGIIERVCAKHPDALILNRMPEEQALPIFCANGVPS